PDLFWALKGGGGGTFGAVSKVTLRVRELPEFWGAAILTVKAASDDAFRRLLRYFVDLYREHLFNDHWGEQARIASDNVLDLLMVCHDLSTEEVRKIWQPFLDWVARSSCCLHNRGTTDSGQYAGSALVGRAVEEAEPTSSF